MEAHREATSERSAELQSLQSHCQQWSARCAQLSDQLSQCRRELFVTQAHTTTAVEQARATAEQQHHVTCSKVTRKLVRSYVKRHVLPLLSEIHAAVTIAGATSRDALGVGASGSAVTALTAELQQCVTRLTVSVARERHLKRDAQRSSALCQAQQR